MRTFTREQRTNAYAAAMTSLKKLIRDDFDLEVRAKASRPDGLKSASYDGCGKAQGISDPVHEAVVSRLTNAKDPASRALTLVMEACRYMELADSERARALPPVKVEVPSEDWCTNCEKHGVLEPRGDPKAVGHGSPLCSWCHSFQREHKCLPPKPLVLKHGRRERIFDRDIITAIGETYGPKS